MLLLVFLGLSYIRRRLMLMIILFEYRVFQGASLHLVIAHVFGGINPGEAIALKASVWGSARCLLD